MSKPMNKPRTPPPNDEYLEGWERIFGNKEGEEDDEAMEEDK